MDCPDLIVSNFMENSIGLKRVNTLFRREMAEKSMKIQLEEDIAAQVKEKGLPSLLHREFVHIETGEDTDEMIRVMQWNVLAQGKTRLILSLLN